MSRSLVSGHCDTRSRTYRERLTGPAKEGQKAHRSQVVATRLQCVPLRCGSLAWQRYVFALRSLWVVRYAPAALRWKHLR